MSQPSPKSEQASLAASALAALDDEKPVRMDLPGGGTLTYVDTKEWATLQVTQDPGKGLALLASVGIVAGLMLSLFVRRRRVWVRVLPGEPSTVEAGGLARTDAERFAKEFEELVREMRERSS